MAGIPARAPGCEAALTGQPWTEATVEAAARGARAGLSTPLDDLRGSAAYRRTAAANLLRRLWAERASPSACSMADRSVRRRRVHQPLRHDSAERHVAGSALYVDDLPEAPGTLHLAFGLAADGHARLTGARSRRGPRRARRGRGLHRRRHPRREQCRPGLPRRPALRRGRDPLSRPAAVRRRRDQHPRRARRRAAGEGRDRAAPRPRHHRRGARGRMPTSSRRSSWRAATPRPRSPRAPHRLPGTRRDGRAGAFLPRRPGRARHAGRGGPAPRRQLDPASERGPASDRGPARPQQRRRDGRGPPDGRRVRRQGDAGRRLCRRLRAGRREDRPPGQDPRRPRRRHGR